MSDIFLNLFDSTDYRAFLQRYLTIKDIKLSDFARAAGCTRGFPSDVLNGRRRLTAKSYHSFEQAFKLPANYKKYFQLLVAKEEPDIFPAFDRSTIDVRLENLKKQKPINTNKNHNTKNTIGDESFHKVLNNPHSFQVYAGAGEPETGALHQEIQQRTRLADNVLDKTIQTLIECQLMSFDNGRYYPKDMHVFFQANNTSEALLKLFTQGARAAEKRLSQITPNSNEMFFASQFCINESQMPHFKKELKDLVLKFIDESMTDDGNRVVKLITALHF